MSDGGQITLLKASACLDDFGKSIVKRADAIFSELAKQDTASRIATINALRLALHKFSPFAAEPVDCIQWIHTEEIVANDYNPNAVAPPEMKLLEHSIVEDGYTQPVVAWKNDKKFEVVDGFHRNRVGCESEKVRKRIHGYLPLTIINKSREDRGDRIAATIRHNRARGKHQVDSMSDIVVELKRRNWTEARIGRELGMDADEILRLCQVTGLADLFSDREFSRSWDVEGEITETDFAELTDDISTYGDEAENFRTVNTSDAGRIFHTHEKWECYKAGFYKKTVDGMSKTECEEAYREFLSDTSRFSGALEHIIAEWKHSCEHYLTNISMNRIAWLGQAAACYAIGIPSEFRSGFFLLDPEEQNKANEVALEYLNKWLIANGRKVVTMEEGYSLTKTSTERQSDIY
jgi:ParB-like chromosome segregation protein Spo0J